MSVPRVPWTFYLHTEPAWNAMIRRMERARVRICFEQFILTGMEEGQIAHTLTELFCRKAQEGLRVQLILDAVGSSPTISQAYVRRLRDAGVEVVIHKTLAYLPKGQWLSFFLRDHRKLVVIDDQIGFIGGVICGEKARTWRDTHVELTGPVVAYLQEAFDIMWGNGVRARVREMRERVSRDGFTVIPNGPRFHHKLIYRELLQRIRKAERRIYLTTPYFAPTRRFFWAMIAAAQRGVDVRLVVPQVSDWKIADLVAQSHFSRAMKHGVLIYQYPEFIHTKAAVIDEWATVGSCNLDSWSFLFDYELNLATVQKEFVKEVVRQFFADHLRSVELTYEVWERRSSWQKFLEKSVFIFHPFV